MNPTDNHIRAARVLRVIDGDTIVVDADFGCYMHVEMPLRIYGINAPEHNQPGGSAATAFLSAWVDACGTAGVVCRTYKPTANGGGDKYGRWLADVLSGVDGSSVATAMINAGHAVPYFGGAR